MPPLVFQRPAAGNATANRAHIHLPLASRQVSAARSWAYVGARCASGRRRRDAARRLPGPAIQLTEAGFDGMSQTASSICMKNVAMLARAQIAKSW